MTLWTEFHEFSYCRHAQGFFLGGGRMAFYDGIKAETTSALSARCQTATSIRSSLATTCIQL